MKNYIFIAITLVLATSCKKISLLEYPCLEESKPLMIDQLNESFEQFLSSNEYKTISEFLELYEDEGKGPSSDSVIFEETDKKLYFELKETAFYNYAFESIDYEDYWTGIVDSTRQRLMLDAYKNNPNPYIFNINSDFVHCMNGMSDKDSVAYYYLSIIKKTGNPSPTVLSSALLKMNSRFKENEQTIRLIALVHFYYPLMRAYYE